MATYRDHVDQEPGQVGWEDAHKQIEMDLVTQTFHFPVEKKICIYFERSGQKKRHFRQHFIPVHISIVFDAMQCKEMTKHY